MRKPKGLGEEGGEGGVADTPMKEGKTPGKEKKKKRDKGDKESGKTPKKTKK